ncbi:IS3 family transposase [Photorhabdus sp. UCH-936]|nr:IS3 family transposase [Photorhabdus antumapuensis]
MYISLVFGLLKSELFSLRKFENIDHLTVELEEYIHYRIRENKKV